MRISGIRAAGLAALVAAACSDTSAPGEDYLLNADVAVVAADGALEGVRMMGGLVMDGRAPVDGARTVTCYDEAGVEQTACDRLTTATMVIAVDRAGGVEREFWSASIERHSELTVTGLLGEETTRTFNGGGTEKVSRSHHSDQYGTRTYDMSGTVSFDNVVIPVRGAESPWPLSGSITRNIVVTITNGPNGDETITRVVTVMFNGTQFATIDVNGEVSELDLGTRPGRFFGPLHERMRRGPRGRRGG
jgi:hypothetical protein